MDSFTPEYNNQLCRDNRLKVVIHSRNDGHDYLEPIFYPSTISNFFKRKLAHEFMLRLEAKDYPLAPQVVFSGYLLKLCNEYGDGVAQSSSC